MAATFLQTNFNTQDPTTYRGAIDANFAVAASIVDNFAPRAAAAPNMTVLLDAGAISTVGGMPVQITQQTSAVLVAPAVNPRRDIVHIDSVSGVIGIATGAEAASPVDPTIPAGKIPIARLLMTVAMVTIPNPSIIDLRAPVMASGGVKFAAIVANTTLATAQSGTTFKLSGVAVTATLPTPIGSAGTRYRFVGTDANTQTISTPAATLNAPDGSAAANWGISNNQVLDIESDGSVWRVMGMEGYIVAQTPATADNSTKVATTAMVQSVVASRVTSVTGTAPVVSSGGITPAISIPAATAAVAGHMTAAYASKLDGIAAGATVGVPVDVGAVGIGTIMMCHNPRSPETIASGATAAGSSLRSVYGTDTGTLAVGGASLPGTWRNVSLDTIPSFGFGTMQRIA